MTERVLPLADGASTCPFVAFEDDRDERATVPDHRHRCYAEARPAPRALAHQQAYCLSSAFPVCPIFQDWARREAARARGGAAARGSAATDDLDEADDRLSAGPGTGGAAAAGLAAGAGLAGAAGGAATGSGAGAGADASSSGADTGPAVGSDTSAEDGEADETPDLGLDRPSRPESGRAPDEAELADGDAQLDDLARRNPPRDWAAPPPWLASAERRNPDAEPPPFLGRRSSDPGQGLAGSPADRLAGGPARPQRAEIEPDEPWSDHDETPGAAAAAAGFAVGRSRREAVAPGRRTRPAAPEDDVEEDEDVRRSARRPRAYSQHLGGPDGPDWERPRRFEAYPTIRTRVGMPHVPRIAAMLIGIVVLMVALFFLPGILGLGGGGGGGTPAGSAGASAAAQSSASLAPTSEPAPTPVLYTIKKGETLLKIATAHGVTLEELLAANPAIKNPNRISEGQQIVIPTPSEAPPANAGSTAP